MHIELLGFSHFYLFKWKWPTWTCINGRSCGLLTNNFFLHGMIKLQMIGCKCAEKYSRNDEICYRIMYVKCAQYRVKMEIGYHTMMKSTFAMRKTYYFLVMRIFVSNPPLTLRSMKCNWMLLVLWRVWTKVFITNA